MSKFIKKEVNDLSISLIRQFNEKAKQVNDVIKLTLGELDLDTFPHIKEAMILATNKNQTRYTANAGILSLRKKIASLYPHYTEDNIILTVGTTEGLAIVIKSILEEGDEVIIPSPGYVGYEPLISLEKAKAINLDLTLTHFKITRAALDNIYSPRCKAIIITNPNNPTGKVLDLVEMETIVSFVKDNDLFLIVDEIYSQIDFTGRFQSFSQFTSLKQQMVILNGFSKSHAMTGLRIGYLLSDVSLTSAFLKVHQYTVSSTSSISQYAALAANINDTISITETLRKRKDFLCRAFDQMNIDYVTPEGAFYLFVNIQRFGLSSMTFCERLLTEARVAVIPGEAFFGSPKNYIRLSYAASMDELKEAIHRIQAFIQSL